MQGNLESKLASHGTEPLELRGRQVGLKKYEINMDGFVGRWMVVKADL